jgi:hypothetical protein
MQSLLDGLDPFENGETGAGGAPRVVLVGLRKPEIYHYTVAEILSDVTPELRYRLLADRLVLVDQIAKVFGVHLTRKGRRAHQVTEHNRELPALCATP